MSRLVLWRDWLIFRIHARGVNTKRIQNGERKRKLWKRKRFSTWDARQEDSSLSQYRNWPRINLLSYQKKQLCQWTPEWEWETTFDRDNQYFDVRSSPGGNGSQASHCLGVIRSFQGIWKHWSIVFVSDGAQSAHGRAKAKQRGKSQIFWGSYFARVMKDDSVENWKKTANKLNIPRRTSLPHSHYFSFVWQVVSINFFGPTRASWSRKQCYESSSST